MYKCAAEKDNQFYSNRLARDVGMGIATGVTARTLKDIADPLVKKRDKRGLALAGLAGLAGLARFGYEARGIYDAYKQYATRPEKTAAATSQTLSSSHTEPTHEDYVARRNHALTRASLGFLLNGATLAAAAHQFEKDRSAAGTALALANIPMGAYTGYQGIRGLYNMMKADSTVPTKTASALETFVATIR